jgi:integrase
MAKGKRRVNPVDYFPARPRSDGRYQKKIGGKLYYFGGVGVDRDEAMAEYQRVRHGLYGGAPVAVRVDGYSRQTLRDAANRYLTARLLEVQAGTLRKVSYTDLRACVLQFVRHLGTHRRFEELCPDLFTAAANHFRRTESDTRWNHIVSAVNAWLNYADEHDWIAAAPKTGPKWRKIPNAGAVRNRLLTVTELEALLQASGDQMRAMLLLALNGGMGPNDLCHIELRQIRNGILDTRRPKTGVRRVLPLWPETIEAIEDYLTARLSPLPWLFITKFGNQWGPGDIGHEFRKMRVAAQVDFGENTGLYVFRHTFGTLTDECGNARMLVMGHTFAGMDKHYSHIDSPNPELRAAVTARLQACVEIVRAHFLKALQSGQSGEGSAHRSGAPAGPA